MLNRMYTLLNKQWKSLYNRNQTIRILLTSVLHLYVGNVNLYLLMWLEGLCAITLISGITVIRL